MGHPEFPIHPEPRSFAWSKLEISCIEKYAKTCVDADRAQRAVPGVQGGEPLNCQRCEGSGEQEHWDRVGESGGYDVTGHCSVCSGSGIAPSRPAQPPQQSAQPVADDGEDAALSAAMQRGNSLGVKSSDALRIIAAYKVAQPAGLQTCNCRWNGETRVQQCTLHQAWEDNQHYQADELRHFRAAQPVEVQRPVIVPGDARAEDMNLKYGESYGVDWEYESGPQTTQTSEPSVISHKLVPLTDEQISLLAHNEDEGDWNDLQFRDCWHKGFKDGFRNAEASLGIKPTSSEGGAA